MAIWQAAGREPANVAATWTDGQQQIDGRHIIGELRHGRKQSWNQATIGVGVAGAHTQVRKAESFLSVPTPVVYVRVSRELPGMAQRWRMAPGGLLLNSHH